MCPTCHGKGWFYGEPDASNPAGMHECSICSRHAAAGHSSGLAAKLEKLCEGAIENHCRMLEAGNGCEDYGRDVSDWCGVCLFAHDVRALLKGGVTR